MASKYCPYYEFKIKKSLIDLREVVSVIFDGSIHIQFKGNAKFNSYRGNAEEFELVKKKIMELSERRSPNGQ